MLLYLMPGQKVLSHQCCIFNVISLCVPTTMGECDTCIPEIRKCRLAINLVWCLWLHFLIIIPACPWVLIAFWILIFDVACLLSIRASVCLFRLLPNTPLKDERGGRVPARSYRLRLNYHNLFSPLKAEFVKKKLFMIRLSCRQLIWLGSKSRDAKGRDC